MLSDDRYRRAAAAGGVCVWDCDLSTGEIYVDPCLKRMLGYRDDEIGNHIDAWLMSQPDDTPNILDRIRALTPGTTSVFEVEHRMLHRDGSTRWFLARGCVTRDAQGRAVSLLGTDSDITERRRGEMFRAVQHQVLEMISTGSALREVLDSLALGIEQLSDGMLCSVLLLDEDGVTIRHGSAPSLAQEYVRAIDGIRIGPSVGSCGTAMHFGKPVIVADIMRDPLWAQYRDVAERFGLRACWSTPIFSPQQRVLGSFAMYYIEPRVPRDYELQLITSAAYVARIAVEHHRAQHALRQSEQRNGAVLRAIPDQMFVTTRDGVYLDYHAKDEVGTCPPLSVFIGKRLEDALPGPLAERFLQAFARVGKNEKAVKLEYELNVNGKDGFFEAHIVDFDDDKILCIVRDVTTRKRAEVEMATQRLELAHLNRVAQLGELTGALAHELRQPLAAILSNAQAARHMLSRDPIDVAELRAALDDVITDNRRAGAFIDHLRKLLRKENSSRQPVSLNDVIREVVDLARSELMARRITATCELAPRLPLVFGDRVQFQQVVLNFLLNACDAMKDTSVSERRLLVSTAVREGTVELRVTDNGTGIPADQLKHVFEPFVTFRAEGVGLGLAISRSIVSAHGGSIHAENNVGAGATFRCHLPILEPLRPSENPIDS